MTTDAPSVERIRRLDRVGLLDLYDRIEAGTEEGWRSGQAFEFMVLRAFEVEGAEVKWPYSVKLGDAVVEQVDGAVHAANRSCLVESKDYASSLNIEPIAKMRNQLSRRPAGTIGLIFARSGFTEPASRLARYLAPQTILLWTGVEVRYAIEHEMMLRGLELKYHHAVEHAIPTFNLLAADVGSHVRPPAALPERVGGGRAGTPRVSPPAAGGVPPARCYIVTEHQNDADMLSDLLIPPLSGDEVAVISGRGRSSALSLAQTLLVTGPASVALLLDADTTHPKRVRGLEAELNESLHSVAAPERSRVLLAVPEFVGVLFHDAARLGEALNESLTEEDRITSRYEPGRVLESLLEARGERFGSEMLRRLIARIGPDRLRETPLIRDIFRFVQEAKERASA